MLSKLKIKLISTSTFAALALAGVLTFTPPSDIEAGSSGIWNQQTNPSTTIHAHARFIKAAQVTFDGSEESTIFTELSAPSETGTPLPPVKKWMKQISIRMGDEPVMVSCDITTSAEYNPSGYLQPCRGINVSHNTLVDSGHVHTQNILVDSQNNAPENDTVLINVSYL